MSAGPTVRLGGIAQADTEWERRRTAANGDAADGVGFEPTLGFHGDTLPAEGVVLFRLERVEATFVTAVLKRLLSGTGPEPAGQFTVVDEERIRQRALRPPRRSRPAVKRGAEADKRFKEWGGDSLRLLLPIGVVPRLQFSLGG
jgi:hypothetical protein